VKKNAIIVDVDGTIAHNDGHREPFEWNKVSADTPVIGVINFIKYAINPDIAIIYVSGRMDECDWDTAKWIQSYVGPKYEMLLMRKTGDYRSDVIVKEEIYRNHIEPHYNVLGVLDDRTKVVNMWRELGLTCLQVAQHDF
jgi:hypothetical protein